MAFSVTVDSKRLSNQLTKMPGYVTQGLYAAARRAGNAFLAQHTRVALSGKTQAAAGPLVGTSYSGGRAEGFRTVRKLYVDGTTLDNLQLTLKIAGGPAKAHEEGRTLRAKSAERLLPVPMKPAKNTKGRKTAAARKLLLEFFRNAPAASAGVLLVERGKAGKRGRLKKGLFKLTASDGRSFLVQRRGKDLKFFFSLQPRVKLKPRFKFYKTWREFTPKATEIFRRGLKFAIESARKAAGA